MTDIYEFTLRSVAPMLMYIFTYTCYNHNMYIYVFKNFYAHIVDFANLDQMCIRGRYESVYNFIATLDLIETNFVV